MKVFIVGITGLLGYEIAKKYIDENYDVSGIARNKVIFYDEYFEKMHIVYDDINELSDDDIKKFLIDVDYLIFAAGIDERVECNPPVYESYYKYNILPLKKLLSICKNMGVKKVIVLGSYFAYFAKECKEMKLCEKHQYIRSRVEQENIAFSYADSKFDVIVLELPYIFGIQNGRKPVWTILIENLKKMDKLPITFYFRGGTTMVTIKQVAEIVFLSTKKLKGKVAFPVGMYNMTWVEFLQIVYKARKKNSHRKIIYIPKFLINIYLKRIVNSYKKRNIENGINPIYLSEIMNKNLFITDEYCRKLGVADDDIEKAICDSIELSEKWVD